VIYLVYVFAVIGVVAVAGGLTWAALTFAARRSIDAEHD